VGLIFTYCILLTTPLVLWFRVAKRMLPPEATEGAAYDRFLVDFKKRLSRHPRLRGHALNSTTDIETALQKLDKHADDLVTSTASAVFLSTAVLQSGRLDVLVVFCRSNTTHLADCPRVLPKTVASGLCTTICKRGFDSFYRCWHRGYRCRCAGWDDFRLDCCCNSGNAPACEFYPVWFSECLPDAPRRNDH